MSEANEYTELKARLAQLKSGELYQLRKGETLADVAALMPAPVFWTATPELRHVQKVLKQKNIYERDKHRRVRYLQQLWRASDGKEEWRDVPTVSE